MKEYEAVVAILKEHDIRNEELALKLTLYFQTKELNYIKDSYGLLKSSN